MKSGDGESVALPIKVAVPTKQFLAELIDVLPFKVTAPALLELTWKMHCGALMSIEALPVSLTAGWALELSATTQNCRAVEPLNTAFD